MTNIIKIALFVKVADIIISKLLKVLKYKIYIQNQEIFWKHVSYCIHQTNTSNLKSILEHGLLDGASRKYKNIKTDDSKKHIDDDKLYMSVVFKQNMHHQYKISGLCDDKVVLVVDVEKWVHDNEIPYLKNTSDDILKFTKSSLPSCVRNYKDCVFYFNNGNAHGVINFDKKMTNAYTLDMNEMSHEFMIDKVINDSSINHNNELVIIDYNGIKPLYIKEIWCYSEKSYLFCKKLNTSFNIVNKS